MNAEEIRVLEKQFHEGAARLKVETPDLLNYAIALEKSGHGDIAEALREHYSKTLLHLADMTHAWCEFRTRK